MSPQDILTANPDLKAIYSACGPPAAGAAQAIKNAKLGSHFILVGFDFCCGEAEALAAGTRGRHGGAVPRQNGRARRRCPASRPMQGEKVELLIDSGAALVTKENMDKFK